MNRFTTPSRSSNKGGAAEAEPQRILQPMPALLLRASGYFDSHSKIVYIGPMTHTFDFSAMTAPERLMLAQQLLDSLWSDAPPFTEQQMEEFRRRDAAADSGAVVCEPWESIRSRLMARE